MNPSHYAVRALLTIFGFAVFVLLAVGSTGDKPAYSPAPPPEVVGQENALTWAKSNSADLATKIQELETGRSHAQSEVYRLESLKRQFPAQASKITGVISEWQQVVIELDSALTAVEQDVSEAYVAHQVQGKDKDAVLGQVYDKWRPKADQAIALAKKQQAKSKTVASE